MSFNPVLLVAKVEKPAWYKDTAQFVQAETRIAVRQLLTTLMPYLLLLALMEETIRAGYQYGITLALGVPAAGLFARIFIFFHDCTHGSFLPSPRWNRNVGYLFGILTFTAFHDWRRSHAGHHITAGDLDRRGMGDITTMTVEEYLSAAPLQRLAYRLYRHPLILLGIGPLYYFLLRNRYPSPGAKKIDFMSVIFTNLAIAAIVVSASLTIGFRTYFLVQMPVLVMAATLGVWLFYNQHQFEGVYWARHDEWDPWRVVMEGASYYQLPKVLQWVTGNIGFHHVHHMRPGIPNYRLQQCYEAIPELQAVKPLTLRKSLGALRLNLYDEQQRRLVSFRSLKERHPVRGSRGGTLVVSLVIAGALLCPGWMKQGIARADQKAEATAPLEESGAAASAEDVEHHTALAGEPLHTVFMGRPVDIPARDRGQETALMLGGVFYTPKQGETSGTPLAAIYLKRMWEESRTRNVISVFVNDLEYDRSFGNLELVTRFENNTLPDGQKEVVNNREISSSDTVWGTLVGSLGPGLRYKVAPFQVDNDLRLQLLGKVGYFYAKRTSDTGPDLVLPPSTMLYGVKLRGRYDGMRRNLLELPHSGMAAGFDLDYMHRANWADFGTIPDAIFTRKDTQNYLQFNGYLMGAGRIPGLSEKNRIFFSLHGGITPRKSADRYNAISINGGPLPIESDDLCRPNYPGTMFNQVLVSDYALAALEYRRELTFFMYLNLRETLIWANRAAVTDTNRFLFKSSTGASTTVGLGTGFFWKSEVYLGYSWDTGFVRNGKPGSGLILVWYKSF